MSDADFFVRLKPYITEQITVSTSAVSPTAAAVNNTAGPSGGNSLYWSVTFPANAAVVEVMTNGIYYTLDGSTPSSTNGQKLNSGDVLTLAGRQKVVKLKMIRQSADSVVNLVYYKE